MFTHSILRYSPPHRNVPSVKDYLSRDHILARQIERCKVKIGDIVRPKSGNKAGWYGSVVSLEGDPSKVEWKKGGKQPYFVEVEFYTEGQQTTTNWYPIKQLRFVR